MMLTKRRTTPGFDFNGLEIVDLTPEQFEPASVAYIKVPPKAYHASARSHKSDKLYTCIEGAVLFEVAGEAALLEYGDLLIVPKDVWFAYHNAGDVAAMLVLMHVPRFDLAEEEFAT